MAKEITRNRCLPARGPVVRERLSVYQPEDPWGGERTAYCAPDKGPVGGERTASEAFP